MTSGDAQSVKPAVQRSKSPTKLGDNVKGFPKNPTTKPWKSVQGPGAKGQRLKGKATPPYAACVNLPNEGVMMKEALERRPWWNVEPLSREQRGTPVKDFNMWWGGDGERFEWGKQFEVHNGMGRRQLVNRFTDHREICTKSQLALNLQEYAAKNKFDISTIIPTTFVLNGGPNGNKQLQSMKRALRAKAAGRSASPTKPGAASPTKAGIGGAVSRVLGNRAPGAENAGPAKKANAGGAGEEEGGKGGAAAAEEACEALQGDMWIVKPAARNRGLGIELFGSLDDAEKYVKEQTGFSLWIIQKYLENPLLVRKRKFDFRLLAMVTHELEVFIYRDSYIRTCSSEYTTSDISDKSIHLTNDFVQKFLDSYGKFEDANKLSLDEFRALLAEDGCNFDEKVWPQIHRCVRNVMKAALHKMNPRKIEYCWELLGFDFMLDTDYRVWLIEINTSPALFRHGKVLTEMMPRMIEEATQKVVDKVFPPPADAELPPQLDRFEKVDLTINDA